VLCLLRIPCSPCLKLKPHSKGAKSGFLTLNVEPYGGGLWHTWFDRDLSVAGRVLLRDGPRLLHKLVRMHAPGTCRPAALPVVHCTGWLNDPLCMREPGTFPCLLCIACSQARMHASCIHITPQFLHCCIQLRQERARSEVVRAIC
jgi:hypothetical protein